MKTIKELGEQGWLNMLTGIGLGDDCALLPGRGNRWTLVTTDTLNEGVHFLRDKISPRDLGAKSLAVNVSDIAAMGGRPLYGFLSVSWTKDLSEQWLKEFLLGVNDMLKTHNMELRGGDTNGVERDLSVTWTVIGDVAETEVKLRSTAKAGDRICVTGNLGDSAAGLALLLQGIPVDGSSLIQSHLRPRPQVPEGMWLAKQFGVHAMMDLSDGLRQDLTRLCRASKKGAQVRVENIPLSMELKRVCAERGWRAHEYAVDGGEDYALLVTVSADSYLEIAKQFKAEFQRELVCVGVISDSEVAFSLEGRDFSSNNSFHHFL